MILQVLLLWAFGAVQATHRSDVVVYGGTAGGVIAAVAAAREGLQVTLVTPDRHLGGNGLGRSWLDELRQEAGHRRLFAGVLSNAWAESMAATSSGTSSPTWRRRVFDDLVKEAGVRVIHGRPPREAGRGQVGPHGDRHRARGRRLVFREGCRGRELRGRSDGASWRLVYLGTRSGDRSTANRSRASATAPRSTSSARPFRPAAPRAGCCRRSHPERADPVGAADTRVQAYNFRLCMTRTAANRVSWPKPAHYSPDRYELLGAIPSRARGSARSPSGDHDVMKAGSAPEPARPIRTTTVAVSTDYIGGSYGYPEGSYAARARIRQAHVD